MLRKNQYFDDTRKSFLMVEAIEDEQRVKRLELQARMVDDRIIDAREFMKDDAFLKFEEFKIFLIKLKQNQLSLQLKLGDSNEKVA